MAKKCGHNLRIVKSNFDIVGVLHAFASILAAAQKPWLIELLRN